MIATIAGVTLRGLVGRRRSLLVLLLAAVPVLIALLVRLAGRIGVGEELLAESILDRLVVTTLLPLVALVFGTAALGSELDDGTAIALLTKPVARWRVVAAKLAVAAGLTAVLTVPTAFVAALLLQPAGSGFGTALGFAAGTAVGSVVYATLFLALSLVTSRALPVGLLYILVWEGILGGLLSGTRVLSVRQYALGIAHGIAGSPSNSAGSGVEQLDVATALGLSALVVGLALAIAVRRLQAWEIREAD